nr:hypothetical protein [Tanacetum cinerariifolium]
MKAGELSKMDPYEEVAQQEQAHPLSPAYVPDPMELDEHVPVYVPEPEHPEYHASSDDDIQVEDDNEDPEEDPSEEHETDDDDEDPEEDPNEEHESKGSEETESFEEDEIAITPPPPRHRGAMISVRPQTPMAASTQALIDAFASGSSLFLLPPTSPAYDQAQLGRRSINSDSDDETHLTSSMVEPSKAKKIKKFDFVTEGGKHIHLTEEEINHQKKIEKEAKAKAAKHESKVRKEELVDLLGPEDPLDKLNDLVNKKRKHADYIHDYFKANKRLKSSVQYEDHLPGTVLNEPVLGMIMLNSYQRQDFVTIEDLKDFPNTMLYVVQEIFFRRHQGPVLDDHARTFITLLLAEIDKRNLNPLK